MWKEGVECSPMWERGSVVQSQWDRRVIVPPMLTSLGCNSRWQLPADSNLLLTFNPLRLASLLIV